MKLQVIGPGCKNCENLAERTVEAADQLGLDYELGKITEVDKFADYGVMMTPGLAVDGDAVVTGTVPGVDEIKELLEEETK
ncbi:MAG: thioredoxin family protein [bacterium]